eukprot:CAMPEP_0172519190 /NCGR_PEP_ID=MMETSP1066-20121228/291266_1 /TAXON_ID=671091 /ORGANISM="Coscinodiscus wailesii, Strain CCMP2513" /LENGTH=225 /DNA_ID=CAMNT_0013301727 /DNA_START=1020 /DNA_END=1697 /DNA_ORIENTATION=+
MDGNDAGTHTDTINGASPHGASVKAGLTVDSLVLLFPPANSVADINNIGSTPPNDNTALSHMPNDTLPCSPPKESHTNNTTVSFPPNNYAGSHIDKSNTVLPHSDPVKVNVTTTTNNKYLPSNYDHTATLAKMSTLQQTIISLTYNLSASKANITSNLLIINTKTKENSDLQMNLYNLQTLHKKLHLHSNKPSSPSHTTSLPQKRTSPPTFSLSIPRQKKTPTSK